MDKKEFARLIELITEELELLAQYSNESFNKETTPTEFEKIVVDVSKKVIKTNDYKCEVEYTEGGHAFPDIIYRFADNQLYGVEVKSSTRTNSPDDNWTTLGNSILGSTRIEVIDVHIIFIKVNKNGCFVKAARYEDAVSDVVVTHSPRYKINLNQKIEESFFNRSNISYSQIKNSENPIGLVTDYFKKLGQTAWWIAESTPAVIRTWEEIETEEKSELLATSFVLFPELLYSQGSQKYKRLSKWLVSKYSVVDSSLRDRFSAGGKVDLIVKNHRFSNLPRIYENFQINIELFLSIVDEIPLEELQLHWEEYTPSTDTTFGRIQYWKDIVVTRLSLKDNNHENIKFIEALFPKVNRP